MGNKKKDIKRNSIIQLVLGVIIIILVNTIGYYVFTRFDLTSEKRYTLSEPTKKILKNLDDIVYFEVYLDGDFPAGFKRLRRETKEMLDEFRAYSDNIQYEFINPSENSDPAEREDVYKKLVERGLQPTDLQVKNNDGTSRQIIFPGTIISYREKEMPVELLKSQMGVPPEEVLNNSIQNLEFNLISVVKKLTTVKKPRVAFIEGHGELDLIDVADATLALQESYSVERVRIDGKVTSLTERQTIDSVNTGIYNKFDAIIIAKPDSAFTEKDKFIIDQYIMRGGKVLWLIDPVSASMDSIFNSDITFGLINDLNLDDQFFTYGIRLNTDLVMDLNALPIPVKTGESGGAPQIDFFPWYYFPVLYPLSDNPIVKNLNAIKTEFISSIDTISGPNVKKTILLTSSQYAKTVNTPALITLEILKEEPDRRLYNKKYVPVSALLEGKFKSVYAGRVPPEIANDKVMGFLEESRPTRMIFVADGDVIKNQVNYSKGKKPFTYPLGYDRYTGQTFGNKDFILNAMDYLIDESGLITIRSREIKLRLLDRTKINENGLYWKILNVVAPVIIILILGLIMGLVRKRKYSG